MSSSGYRAWNRASMRHAWVATRSHFSSGWRSVAEALGPGVVITLALYIWGSGAESARDNVVAIAAGVAVSVLWSVAVFSWNFSMAPYRLWRESRSRIAELEAAAGERAERQAIARELERCIHEGQALSDEVTFPQAALVHWYGRAVRAASLAGEGERAIFETLGAAPRIGGGVPELQLLANRIAKLRLIMGRQYDGSR